MFMGPLEAVKPWSMKGVEGVYRFLARACRMIVDADSDEIRLVDLEQPIHAGQHEHDPAQVRDGAAAEVGSRAPWDDRHACLVREAQHGRDFLGTPGKHNQVRAAALQRRGVGRVREKSSSIAANVVRADCILQPPAELRKLVR